MGQLKSKEDMILELVNIGRKKPGDPNYGDPSYDSNYMDKPSAKKRAQEIGKELYQTGGHQAMLDGGQAVKDRLGTGALRELDFCWNCIGKWMA